MNAPTDPTKTGYTFGSWFLDADKTEPVTWPITIHSNLTLYATWTTMATAAHPAPSTPVQLPNSEMVTEPTTSLDSNKSGVLLTSLLHNLINMCRFKSNI